MPEPNPGESRDEFIARCIPQVLEDGTAKTPEQAAAICHSIFDGKDFEHIQIEKSEKRQSFGICKANDVDEDERTLIATISTDTVDRSGEIVRPDGAEFSNYAKNPIVLWQHNPDEPIGKALWIKRNAKQIIAKIRFAVTEKASEIFELFKGGFLNAFSIGFISKQGHIPTPDEIRTNPVLSNARYIHDKWELLEFSGVAVPANPEALQLAYKNHNLTLSEKLYNEFKLKSDETKEEEIILDVREFYPEIKEIEIIK